MTPYRRPIADAEHEVDPDHEGEHPLGQDLLSPRHTFSFAFVVAIVGFLVFFVAGTRIDLWLAGGGHSFWSLLGGDGGSDDSLLYLAQVVAAILGVALTVVAIVVQLAANRYTAKIIDLFVRDPVNVPTLALFVVTVLEGMWVSHIRNGGFHPRVGVLVTLSLSTASMLSLLPYFRHVFRFLEPANVVHRIRDEIVAEVRGARGHTTARECALAQARVMNWLDHLFDIVRNALANADRTLATEIIFAFRDALVRAYAEKKSLPPLWFRVSARAAMNADFLNFPEPAMRRFEEERTWLERKVFWQMNLLFQDALGQMRGVCSTIALVTRERAEEALRAGDRVEARLCVRALNTYLRSALRGGDVRSAFNVLQQYRLYAEVAVRLGDRGEVRELFAHFAYYGRLAESMGMGFVLETAAHDLVVLCKAELAGGAGVGDADVAELVAAIVDLARDPEGTPLAPATRRGVRRSQAVLAVHLLARGREDLARRVAVELASEPEARLASIREELDTSEAEFFELTERVSSFGHVPVGERPFIATFFDLVVAPRVPPTEKLPPLELAAASAPPLPPAPSPAA